MFGTSTGVSRLVGRFAKLSFHQLTKKNVGQLLHTAATVNVRLKDIVPTSPASAGSQDILLQNIRSAKDSSDILNTINRHHSIMNSNHIVQALKAIFTLQKAHNSRMSNGEVVSSKDFSKLCEVLKSQIRHIELSELIDVLKCLGYLGVPANAKIMSIVLSLVTKQVNDLSLNQITFLDFIMKDFKHTPLVRALHIALPIVFEANLPTKCDFDNISQLCDLLSFVTKRNMEKSCDILVDAIVEKREELNSKDATSVVFSMCDSRIFNEKYQLLICYALDIITDSLNKMDFFEMESLLSKLCIKYVDTAGDPAYYHEEFCNACNKMVVDKDYSFEQSLWILKKMVKYNHVHLPLLDHITRKVEREPWQLEQCGVTGYITFLSGLSLSDYRPPNWERIKPLVLKACQGFMDRPELPWLRLVIDLCILDCWSEELIQKVFSREFLLKFMARESKLDKIQLLTLDQVSATLSPWAIKPRAPSDIILPIKQVNGNHVKTFPFQPALQHGLGGQEYLLTGVHTSLGHFLDHVVVMRKGGYPVAINLGHSEAKEQITAEDIQVPNDSKMIAVLLVPSTLCSVNNERVRGLFRIHINSIEALDIAVAPILQPVWNTLPDNERIPYLMRTIQNKLTDTERTDVIVPA